MGAFSRNGETFSSVQACIKHAEKHGNGPYSCGENLSLVVRGGSALWTYQFRNSEGKTEMKYYGSAVARNGDAAISLTQARYMRMADVLARKQGRAVEGGAETIKYGPLFAQARDTYLDNHKAEWSPKVAKKNRDMLLRHTTVLDTQPVGKIARDEVAALLRAANWQGPGSTTASRVRAFIEKILDAPVDPKGNPYVKNNPARWKGALENVLSKKIEKSTPRAALPYQDVPALMAELTKDYRAQAGALQFIILTACRVDEALTAKWGDFDLGSMTWTKPEDVVKERREHRVPITPEVLACMGPPGARGALVFAPRVGRKVSGATVRDLLYGLRQGVTVHGFRSSFMDWGTDRGHRQDALDRCLDHIEENDVRAAYKRSDLFDARRPIMREWAAFCDGSRRKITAAPSLVM